MRRKQDVWLTTRGLSCVTALRAWFISHVGSPFCCDVTPSLHQLWRHCRWSACGAPRRSASLTPGARRRTPSTGTWALSTRTPGKDTTDLPFGAYSAKW